MRFLGAVASGWVAVRVFLLWPHLDSAAAVLQAIVPIAAAEASPAPGSPVVVVPIRVIARPPAVVAPAPPIMPHATEVRPTPDAVPGQSEAPRRAASVPLLPGLPQPVAPINASAPSRWSGSAWLVARGGAGLAPGTLGGQLGGSQAGVRLVYALNRRHRVALVGRVTTPLGAGLREASLGVEWQPTRLPVRVVVEQRIALSGGTSGPAAGVVGGFGPVAIPLGFRLEGYGQAGVIRRSATEPYADGALRLGYPVAAIGRVRIELGAGVWGGAQRGAARLDLGPSLGVIVPIAAQSLRIALDWRERVAGDAHPGSGPALTFGGDF